MIAAAAVGLGGVALFTAAGAGLAELSPALRRLPLGSRLGYAYLLGLAAVPGALFALSHLAAMPLRTAAVWAVAAVPAAIGLLAALWRRRRERERAARRRRDPVVLVCFGVVALIALGLAAQAASDPVNDWDGRMTWSAEARYMRAAATVDAEVLRHRRWFITHPQYPPLLPLAQVAVLEAFAADGDSHAFRMLYAAAFVAWLLVVQDGARRLAGRRAAALAMLLAAAVPFYQYGEGGGASAYSDLPLAAFYGAALVLLVILPPRPADAGAAGLFLAGAVLAKNEGLPLAALVAALALGQALLRGRRTRRRALAAAAAVGLAALAAAAACALLASWRAGIPNREDEAYLANFHFAELWPVVFTRLPGFVPLLLERMVAWKSWTAFWWAIPALLVAGRRAVLRPRRLALALFIAAAAPPAIGWIAYSTRPDGAAIAAVTWDRFLLQGSVPLMILAAGALADVLRRRGGLLRAQRRALEEGRPTA